MSVTTYLEKRASEAVLSSSEVASINTSISTIESRLTSYFGNGLSEQLRFGSSTRGTILPRSMDEHSDIDYMVVFSEKGYNPQTYLDRLKRFADYYYSSSEIKQSSPSIVLELEHIKFDLVPALKAESSAGYQIPNGPSDWRETNPNDFNAALTAKNSAELQKIKPTIRLIKFWNAQAGYVYDSYWLEKYVVELAYYGITNQRDYLFNVVDNLFPAWQAPQWCKDKIQRAKDIVKNVREYELNDYPYTAESEVKKLIPE